MKRRRQYADPKIRRSRIDAEESIKNVVIELNSMLNHQQSTTIHNQQHESQSSYELIHNIWSHFLHICHQPALGMLRNFTKQTGYSVELLLIAQLVLLPMYAFAFIEQHNCVMTSAVNTSPYHRTRDISLWIQRIHLPSRNSLQISENKRGGDDYDDKNIKREAMGNPNKRKNHSDELATMRVFTNMEGVKERDESSVKKETRQKPPGVRSSAIKKKEADRIIVKQNYDFSWDTALAIVPPDNAWDQLQRARHFAGDSTYSLLPPAIRLFHPFVDHATPTLQNAAFDIASIIEKHNIQPFTITLSKWSIIPSSESFELSMMIASNAINRKNTNKQQTQRKGSNEILDSQSNTATFYQADEDRKVQELIAREERIGKEKLKLRLEKISQQQRTIGDGSDSKESVDDVVDNDDILSTDQVPSTDIDSFDGPCVICVEPDEVSLQRLRDIRWLLVQELYPDFETLVSPSGLYFSTVGSQNKVGKKQQLAGNRRSSNQDINVSRLIIEYRKKLHQQRQQQSKRRQKKLGYEVIDESIFRPVIPIGFFPSVTSAVPIAQQLRSSWQPLVFNFTNLQIMSATSIRTSDDTTSSKVSSPNTNFPPPQGEDPRQLELSYATLHNGLGKSSNNQYGASPSSFVNEGRFSNNQHTSFLARREFGCDALITLMGTEMEANCRAVANENFEPDAVTRLLAESGEQGGYFNSIAGENIFQSDVDSRKQQGYYGDSAESLDDGNHVVSTPLLDQWLEDDDDDEYDDGTVVIIGRTRFMTGEARTFAGMPASSTRGRSTTGNNSNQNPGGMSTGTVTIMTEAANGDSGADC